MSSEPKQLFVYSKPDGDINHNIYFVISNDCVKYNPKNHECTFLLKIVKSNGKVGMCIGTLHLKIKQSEVFLKVRGEVIFNVVSMVKATIISESYIEKVTESLRRFLKDSFWFVTGGYIPYITKFDAEYNSIISDKQLIELFEIASGYEDGPFHHVTWCLKTYLERENCKIDWSTEHGFTCVSPFPELPSWVINLE